MRIGHADPVMQSVYFGSLSSLSASWRARKRPITTDVRPLGYADGMEFCRELPHRVGVVAIPSVVFYDDQEAGRPQVRFAFCKRQHVLAEALSRLARAGRGGAELGD
jgi:aspartate/methionine/tyrosine aminotransferase